MGNSVGVLINQVEKEIDKPADGSDVETLEEAQQEIARLRMRIIDAIPLSTTEPLIVALVRNNLMFLQ